ncbi:MAG: KaiC domain-containing protein [Halobacteriota archaeon]
MPNNDDVKAFEFETPLDDAFESEIERIDIGIDGLDAMIEGGVPRRSLMVAIGGPGTGKTTFGQQFVNHGLEQGERCVFLSLEEPKERLVRSAVERGWRFDDFVQDGSLAIIDLDPVEMATRLGSIRNELPQIIEDFGAERLVLDSVSLLELMFESPAHRRNQIYDFTNSLKLAGVTTLLTSEAREGRAYTSKYELVEYLTDVVFVLRRVRETGGHDSGLAIEIIKIRDANHERDAKPMELTRHGLEVYQRANIF